MSVLRRKILTFALVTVWLVSAVYVFQYRYFTRMVPVPFSFIQWLYDGGENGPAPRLRPNGRMAFPRFALTTEAGLRDALDYIRSLSPTDAVSGFIKYKDIDFDSWVEQIKRKTMFCTDATMLFQLMARAQGVAAREWWIWGSSGYEGGSAHSVVEFYNPALPGWQVVDALTATIIRDEDGRPVSMAEILRRRQQGGWETLRFDQSPHMARLNMASYDTRHLLTINTTPVLNLKPPSWFASTPKTDLLIALPVLVGNGRHNVHVFTTKIVFAVGVATAIAAMVLIAGFYRLRARPVEGPLSPSV